MSQPEEEIIEKPAPFDTDRFLERLKEGAAKADAERQGVFLTRGLGGNSEERIRDAVQREKFWTGQIEHLQSLASFDAVDMAHAREELAHALFVQGRTAEALSLAQNPERRAYYLGAEGL